MILEKKASTFLLLIIIAVQTLIVAALAVFVFIVGVRAPQMAASADSMDMVASPNAPDGSGTVITMLPPDEADLTSLDLFGENKYFNLKNDGDGKNSVIVVNVSVKYFNKIDGIKNVAEKMNLNKANLQEIVGLYFQNKTLDEVKEADTRVEAKEILKKDMNEFLLSTIDKEKDRRKVTSVIYDVVFSGWTYQ